MNWFEWTMYISGCFARGYVADRTMLKIGQWIRSGKWRESDE